MKTPGKLLLAFLLLYLFITLAPAAVYRAVPASGAPAPEPSPTPPSFLDQAPLPEPKSSPASAGPQPSPESRFTLHDAATGQTLEVDEREFLAAAVACEMDLHSPEEALKAQAVAAYTYYCRQRQDGQAIACDTENWLVYTTEEAMRARWGEDYDGYRALLDGVVDAVYGQTLTYQGRPILACYFAISPGSTEAACNVWSPDAARDHPYLQAVASPGDLFSDGCLSHADFTAEELRAALADGLDGPDLSGPAEGWISELTYTPSGMVKSAQVGGVTASGTQLRSALGLRSACFQYEIDSAGDFHFKVKGWGHGVGMSQAGAVFLAKRGADYREILARYYPGATLTGVPGPEG